MILPFNRQMLIITNLKNSSTFYCIDSRHQHANTNAPLSGSILPQWHGPAMLVTSVSASSSTDVVESPFRQTETTGGPDRMECRNESQYILYWLFQWFFTSHVGGRKTPEGIEWVREIDTLHID
jgi:hypothetical protein